MGCKIFYFIQILIFFSSCTMFSPRNSENPENDDYWIEPFSPSISIENYIKSYNTKNPLYYIRTLENSFQFIPYSNDTIGSSGLFQNWDLSKENQYIDIIFTEDYFLNITLAESLLDSTDTNALFYYTYEVIQNDTANGLLLFYIISDFSGIWYIEKIEDLGSGNNSWTNLRKNIFIY